MSKHQKFISTSIEELLEDAVGASQGISSGICSVAISDYIFQSLFLRMTEFLEQKSKCLCWEMGTEDFDFRRTYLIQHGNLGEMSTNDSKKFVFVNLEKVIQKRRKSYNAESDIDKEAILQSVKQTITDLFTSSNLRYCRSRHFMEFSENYNSIFMKDYFVKDGVLLLGKLYDAYDCLYDFRNRCAHNVHSYQQNLPSLDVISDSKYVYENYYIRYALLLLIDKVYIQMYNTFGGR